MPFSTSWTSFDKKSEAPERGSSSPGPLGPPTRKRRELAGPDGQEPTTFNLWAGGLFLLTASTKTTPSWSEA